MTLDLNQPIDIFIAYHGDRTSGSAETAHAIYHHLSDNGIHAFIHQETPSEDARQDTAAAAAKSKLFLLVIDQAVPRDAHGRLDPTADDDAGSLRQEMEAFRSGHSFRENGHTVSRVFLCRDIPQETDGQYTSLHPIFHGTDCLCQSDYSDVDQWIKDTVSLPLAEQPASKTEAAPEIELYKKYLKLVRSNAKASDPLPPEEKETH